MPAIEQVGQPPGALHAFLEPLILEQCGGTLCVTLSYVDQDGRPIEESDPRFTAEGPDDPEICGFSPDQSGATADREVDRRDVVTLVFVCRSSDLAPEGNGDGGDGETDTEGTDAPSGEVTTEALSSAGSPMGTLEP